MRRRRHAATATDGRCRSDPPPGPATIGRAASGRRDVRREVGAGRMVSPVLPQSALPGVVACWGASWPDRPDLRVRDTVVVFARAPRLGTVKRRLAREIGDRAALRFHTGTLVRLLRGLLRDGRFRTVLALTPDGARDRLPPRVARIGQGRGDIGARMDAAFRRYRKGNMALIGS